MATASVPVGEQFEVLNPTTVRYNGTIYHDVTSITLGDGTVKTCSEILDEAGGVLYSEAELKKCVKVEGYDSYANNRQVFSVYSGNSRQVSKNMTGSVPGNMWCEMFDFRGDADTNYIVKMWSDAGLATFLDTWLGFRLNYGVLSTRAYVITQVNDFLEESKPSPPSTVDVNYRQYEPIKGAFRAVAPVGGHYCIRLYSAGIDIPITNPTHPR